MIFGNWNVQGLSRKQDQIFKELKSFKIDVAVLNETKKKGSGSEYKEECILLYSGVDKDRRARAGVGIAVRKQYVKNIKSWNSVNKRIIKMEIE